MSDPPDDESGGSTDVPEEVVQEITRLTRFMRRVVDDAERGAYRERRSELLEDYGLTARIREDDTGDVLVCYPEEWVDEDGTVRTERIEDLDRGIERPLSGPGNPDDWEAIAEHNRELATAVRRIHGDVHGDNADALAAYMNNHCAKRIETATGEDLRRFRETFFVRNCWPSDEQREVIDNSIAKTLDVAGVPDPRTPP